MKIKNSVLRKKCLSEKYYASIKYMSHSLKGEERRYFIKRVCDINIYLGSQCALTCEQDKVTEGYINNIINNYFKPKKVRYIDPTSGQATYTERRLRSFDIANYLLACNLIGKTKAINWYVNTHDVQKSILIQLASDMDEEQLINFLLVLAKSEQNKDKLRGIGSAKNIYSKKNDKRVKELLTILWFEDKDAFIQLAYDTGWLSEIWKHNKNGKSIYIHLLNKSVKQKLTLEYIQESVGGEDELLKILYMSDVGKNFIYLMYLEKMQRGEKCHSIIYNEFQKLPEPSEKIKNYYIPFFLELKKEVYRDNINYSYFYRTFEKVYTEVGHRTVNIGVKKSKMLADIIKDTEKTEWRGVLDLYFLTYFGETVSLDELFAKLNFYHEIQQNMFINEISKYIIPCRLSRQGMGLVGIRTENAVRFVSQDCAWNDNINVRIEAYDYIERCFYVKRVEQ